MVRISPSGLRSGLKKLSSQLLVAVLVAGIIAFIGVFILQSVRIKDMQAEVHQKQLELAAVQERNDRLQQHLDFYNGPGYMLYVEKVSREALGLARPGETVILPVPEKPDPSSDNPKEKASAAAIPPKLNKKPTWQSWFGFFFGQ